jgi:hypothetical protein
LAKRKISFAKTGILALAMLVALGALGATFSMWAETLYVDSSVSIGTVNSGLVCGTCSPSVGETSIGCQPNGGALQFTVTNATSGVDYSCQFKVQNTGSLPVRIQSIAIAGEPSDVNIWVTDVYEGDLIDDGDFIIGTVHVNVEPDSLIVGDDFIFTITITVVQWNEYVP